jgi:hypothetical protein
MILYNLQKMYGETWKSTVDIFGVPHHVYLIRVHDINDVQVAVDDPYGLMGVFNELNDESLMTIRVPDLTGEYVAVIFPYAR